MASAMPPWIFCTTTGTPYVNNPVTTFANNTGWYDDTSDGSVCI